MIKYQICSFYVAEYIHTYIFVHVTHAMIWKHCMFGVVRMFRVFDSFGPATTGGFQLPPVLLPPTPTESLV